MATRDDPEMPSATDPAGTSRYDNDPRVTRRPGGGFTVTDDDGTILHVLHTDEPVVAHPGSPQNDVHAWVIRHDDRQGSYVQAADGGLAIVIATADGALAALLGDPVPADGDR